jgi:hypothetical protein
MLREPEFFGDQLLTLVYLARRLREARAVEAALDAGSIDYIVVTEPYAGGLFFSSPRVGALFYVSPQVEAQARALLVAQGFIPLNESQLKNTDNP